MKLTKEQLNKVCEIIENNEQLQKIVERRWENLEPVYDLLCEIAVAHGIAEEE